MQKRVYRRELREIFQVGRESKLLTKVRSAQVFRQNAF